MESKRVEKYGQDVAKAYEIIASYRWDESFVCSGCDGDSFFEGKYPYSRRCLTCKKDTSPTAGTIFHGVRFPLHIALYIVKQSIASNHKPTSQELTDDILRRFKHKIRDKTVWAFIIKIYGAMKIPEYTFTEIIKTVTFNKGGKRILVVKGFFVGNVKYFALVEDESNYKKIRSLVDDYKLKKVNLPNFSEINIDYSLNNVRPKYYQSYLNFQCFIANGNRFEQLMNILTKPL